MSDNRLIEAAFDVRQHAHAPYSQFSVGAALLTKSGKIFVGCNIENIALRLTIRAEQAAVAAAVTSGDVHFVASAVVADANAPVVPCGACCECLRAINPATAFI